MVNLNKIKSDFPIFQTYPDLVYLDSAATSQKPRVVIDAVYDFYTKYNANIHRGIYKLAETATEIYEQTRKLAAEFINADKPDEIIFTANTNYAINLVTQGWAKKFLKKGDIIVLSEMEHHANILPWMMLKKEIGVELLFLPIDENGKLDYKAFLSPSPQPSPLKGEGELDSPFSLTETGTNADKYTQPSPVKGESAVQSPLPLRERVRVRDAGRIKLVALTHASNVLGTINPVADIISFFKQQGIQAKFLIDAAQSIPHMPVDVKQLGCDFLAFSSHKMLGPAGVGVLWAKEELLEAMDPLIYGSSMIKTVTKEKAAWADLPDKFEAGTPNLEGVAGFGAAIKYLQTIGMENISEHEQKLTQYALKKLSNIPYVTLYGPSVSQKNNAAIQQFNNNRLGIFSFNIQNVHPHDAAQILDSQNICIRSGHHCAQILMQKLKVPATSRASIYLYNTEEDVDSLVEGIKFVKKTLKI